MNHFFSFLDWISFYSPTYRDTHYVPNVASISWQSFLPQALKCWDYACEAPCSINLCFLVEMFRLFIFNVFVERITVAPFCHSYSSYYSLPFSALREIILICFILGGFIVISLLFLVILLGLTEYLFNLIPCGQMVFYLM